jgi:hypothetical protein
MSKKTAWVLFCGFVISFVCSPGRTDACVCSRRGENAREAAPLAFEEAAIVFEGEVTAIRAVTPAPNPSSSFAEPASAVTTLNVTRAYKGINSSSIELIEEWADSDCGIGEPAVGTPLFIYGFKGQDGMLYIHACLPVFPSSAGPDLRYARGEPPTEDDLVPFDEELRLFGHPDLATMGAILRGKVASLNSPEMAEAHVTVWQVDEKGCRQNLVGAQQKVHPDGSLSNQIHARGHLLCDCCSDCEITMKKQ